MDLYALVPIVGTGTADDPKVPKYVFAARYPYTMMQFGDKRAGLVHVKNVDPADAALLHARADAFVFTPGELGADLDKLSNFLQVLGIRWVLLAPALDKMHILRQLARLSKVYSRWVKAGKPPVGDLSGYLDGRVAVDTTPTVLGGRLD